MTIKTGHKVKFADCAKHLKSYDKDAVGKVYKMYGSIASVEWDNGTKTKQLNIKNLTRYRGSQYKESKKQVSEKDGWIKWEGGKCPVERGALVDVRMSSGEEFNYSFGS